MVYDAFVVKVRVLFMTALIYCQRNFKKNANKNLSKFFNTVNKTYLVIMNQSIYTIGAHNKSHLSDLVMAQYFWLQVFKL